MTVNLLFVPEAAKAAGLLEQLLTYHGLRVSPTPFSSPAAGNASGPCVLAVKQSSLPSRPTAPAVSWTMVMDPDPQGAPPEGVLEFSRAGVAKLVDDIRGCDDELERRSADERRRWNLARFRFGLWLQFSRATGSGKFDPFPLTSSKKRKTVAALLPELAEHSYGGAAAAEALGWAVDRVWARFDELIPPAVHVVDAIAEAVWRQYAPQMLDRRAPRPVGISSTV